ncbi:hypothetical protein QFC20_002605 [Naganishia adeliensis]|uniref:Uncharacterized protein n=1 Tax=Naganishia adeliensis TaxID=92952 RepID=A0ACC2WJG7_9TREE|nr:hypothetical protein QFC20_002605 [Naganishia adeliensis]
MTAPVEDKRKSNDLDLPKCVATSGLEYFFVPRFKWCSKCRTVFINAEDALKHKREMHHYCRTCDRLFYSQEHFYLHHLEAEDALDHQAPFSGGKPISSTSKDHSCDRCSKQYTSGFELVAHFEAAECCPLSPSARSKQQLKIYDQNYYESQLGAVVRRRRSNIHHNKSPATYSFLDPVGEKRSGTTPRPLFRCGSCSQGFSRALDFIAHRLLFHPMVNIDEANKACPFCQSQHTSTSAVVAHLESGSCSSGAKRGHVDDYVFNAFSNRQAIENDIIQRSDLRSDLLELLRFYRAAPNALINSSGQYQCPFCPGLDFSHVSQLNQHLKSPAHSRRDPALYRCPICHTATQTLSGLLHHTEMTNCGMLQTAWFNKWWTAWSNASK